MILESFFICNKNTFCKPMRLKFILFLTWITCLLLTRSLFFLRNDLALSIASSSSAISVSSLLNGNEKQAILQWFLDDLIKIFIFPRHSKNCINHLIQRLELQAWTLLKWTPVLWKTYKLFRKNVYFWTNSARNNDRSSSLNTQKRLTGLHFLQPII